MALSKSLVKSFVKKTVRKSAQAAAWLPAVNLKLQSLAYKGGHKVTNSEVLESTSFVANEMSLVFKRFAEGRGDAPKQKLEEMAMWFMADVAFGMENDARKLSVFFNRFSTLFEELSNEAGKEAKSLAQAYWDETTERSDEEQRGFEPVSLEDIEAEVNVFDIQMNQSPPR